MKAVDRYLLKEMIFPFVIAAIGFLIFISLSLILQLSDFMLDKSLSFWTMAQILFYKLPEFFVWSLPVATLFAIFLALGRLSHDKEVIALQAASFSLKRIVLPILIISLLLSFVNLFLNNQMTPWANQRYQQLIRQMIFRRSAPQISDNTFFKDSEGRFFYVRHYDRERGVLQGVMVYDLTGEQYLSELSGKYPKVITAEEATWQMHEWELKDAAVHTFDDQGQLRFAFRAENLKINVGEDLGGLFLEQRTPHEMSLKELGNRIRTLKESGLRAEGLIVEYHSKIAIPMAGFVFALFAAPLSLIFGLRSIAAGVVISISLVVLFQGTLIWAQALGRREIIDPAISTWIPNIIFGLVGAILFLLMDRVSKVDLKERLRKIIPIALLTFIFASPFTLGEEVENLELSADSIIISEDWNRVTAEGNVRAGCGENSIQAGKAVISKEDESWKVQALKNVIFVNGDISAEADEVSAEFDPDGEGKLILRKVELVSFFTESKEGSVKYSGGRAILSFKESLESLELSGGATVKYEGGSVSAKRINIRRGEGSLWQAEAEEDVIFAEGSRTTRAGSLAFYFELEEGKLVAKNSLVEEFTGEGKFENARGETHLLRYEGRKARATFAKDNQINILDITKGEFTTCGCTEEIKKEAYCIDADKVLIFSDDLLVSTNITLHAFGVPVFWSPIYLAPLKKEWENPLFPELGRSSSRGWYAKWRLPFILKERNYGFLSLDYFNRFHEIGGGLDFNYDLGKSNGRIHLYRLLGLPDLLDLSLSHHTSITDEIAFDVTADFRNTLLEQEEGRHIGSQARLSGNHEEWRWSINLSRDQYLGKPQTGEEERYRILERLPEISIVKKAGSLDLFNYSFGISWGRYREKKLDAEQFDQSSRFEGLFNLSLRELSLFNSLKLRLPSSYRLSLYGEVSRREVFGVSPSLDFNIKPGLSLSANYTYRLIKGRTPFNFDFEEELNRANIRAVWSKGNWRGNLSTGYDFQIDYLDPLELSLSYRIAPSNTRIDLDFDLNDWLLKKASFEELISGEGWSLSATTAYDFLERRFDDLIVKLALRSLFRVGLSYDLNNLQLERANIETSCSASEDWELSFKGEYDFPYQRFTAFQYGIIRSFCHNCWEIGLYGSKGQVWIQARINAFPTAGVKYSPTDQRLAFGED